MSKLKGILNANIKRLLDASISYGNDYIMTDDEFVNVILRNLDFFYSKGDLMYFDKDVVMRVSEKYFFLESENEIIDKLIESYFVSVIGFCEEEKYEMKMCKIRVKLLTVLINNIEVSKEV